MGDTMRLPGSDVCSVGYQQAELAAQVNCSLHLAGCDVYEHQTFVGQRLNIAEILPGWAIRLLAEGEIASQCLTHTPKGGAA